MKVQVTMSDDMVKRIDKYADQMGVSRSALCSVILGQHIMNLDNTAEAIQKLGNEMVDKAISMDTKSF